MLDKEIAKLPPHSQQAAREATEKGKACIPKPVPRPPQRAPYWVQPEKCWGFEGMWTIEREPEPEKKPLEEEPLPTPSPSQENSPVIQPPVFWHPSLTEVDYTRKEDVEDDRYSPFSAHEVFLSAGYKKDNPLKIEEITRMVWFCDQLALARRYYDAWMLGKVQVPAGYDHRQYIADCDPKTKRKIDLTVQIELGQINSVGYKKINYPEDIQRKEWLVIEEILQEQQKPCRKYYPWCHPIPSAESPQSSLDNKPIPATFKNLKDLLNNEKLRPLHAAAPRSVSSKDLLNNEKLRPLHAAAPRSVSSKDLFNNEKLRPLHAAAPRSVSLTNLPKNPKDLSNDEKLPPRHFAAPRRVRLTNLPRNLPPVRALATITYLCQDTGPIDKIEYSGATNSAIVDFVHSQDALDFEARTANGISWPQELNNGKNTCVFVDLLKRVVTNAIPGTRLQEIEQHGASRVVRIITNEVGLIVKIVKHLSSNRCSPKNDDWAAKALAKHIAGSHEGVEFAKSMQNSRGNFETRICLASVEKAITLKNILTRDCVDMTEAVNVTFGEDP
ncbi:hypothetical protein EDC01DRAFT_727406 [Geopyxis carbonaria]|nr:hypothetical protein EDC01DRAFT_727406 [Geopyxis carbonaria]